jgi:hypothetical protein
VPQWEASCIEGSPDRLITVTTKAGSTGMIKSEFTSEKVCFDGHIDIEFDPKKVDQFIVTFLSICVESI